MCEKKRKRGKVTVRRIVVGECWPPGRVGEVPKPGSRAPADRES